MVCACGKTALTRVGSIGYCSEHRPNAVAQIAKLGNPKAKKRSRGYIIAGPPLVHVDRLSTKQIKELQRKQLRANPTPAEIALGKILKSHELTKGKYEFQPIIHGYIPDFLYRMAKIIIEADGAHHYTPDGKAADARRTQHLKAEGYIVIRFNNREILHHPERVVEIILKMQHDKLSSNQ